MKSEIKAKVSIAIVCSILAFCITWQFKSVKLNQGQGTISGLRSAELQTLYHKEKEKNEALLSDYIRISGDLEKYKAAANDTNATTKILKEQLDNAEILSGMKEVNGEGIIVKMSDSKFNSSTENQQDNLYILHDSDILLVINELRDAGAEAVSVNGERLTALSEIRCVGSVISVNNVRIASPFVINAIGNSDTLESALLFRGGVVSELASYGFEFDIKKSTNVTVPGYKGAISFKYAKPAENTTQGGNK